MTIRPKHIGLFCLLMAALLVITPPAHTQEKEHTEEVSFSYTLDQPGQVSAAVYDQDGMLLRELLRGEKQKAGEHTLHWDGLDREGNPLSPGEYEWRILRTPGFKAEYITTLGTNTPGTPDDDWVGNHGPLRAVLSDGKRIYVGTLAENVPCHIAMTIDGSEILWRGGIRLAHGGSHGMNISGNLLYDLRTSGRWEAPRLYAVDIDTGDRKVFFQLDPDMKRLRMDAASGNAVVVSADSNVARWYTISDDILEEESLRRTWGADEIERGPYAEVQVKSPRDVAVDAEGNAFVITRGKVVRLTPEKDSSTVIPQDSLNNPYRLAWVPEYEEILVAERTGSHQIKRFSLPDGKLLDTYGTPGGRPYGPYDPLSFRDINDVAPDGHGGFLIVEGGINAMQRTARFDEDGNLIDQWFGPQMFFNHAMPDPQEPSRVFINSGRRVKTELKVDYETGEWEVVADYYHPRFGDGLFPETSGPHHQWHVRHRNGEMYLICDNASRFGILRVDRDNYELVPIAVSGSAHNPEKRPLPEPLAQAIEHHNYDIPGQKWRGIIFAWSDRNQNGEFEPDEFKVGGRGMGGRKVYITRDWDVFGHVFPRKDSGGGRALLMQNEATEDQSIPVWNPQDVQKLPGRWPESFERFQGAGSRGGVYVDEAGNIYRHVGANGRPEHDRPAPGWPTNNTGVHRFIKWDSSGDLRWSVGRQSSVNAVAVTREKMSRLPGGYFFQPCAILGKTHGTIVMADRVGLPATAWTTDGLYAGYFLDRRADDGLSEAVYTFWRAPGTKNDGPMPYDMFTGGSIVERDNGDVIWFPMGRNESPVYRITGWDGWTRRSGDIELQKPPVSARGEGNGVEGQYFDNPDFQGEPVVTRVDPFLWFTQRKRQDRALDRWVGEIIEMEELQPTTAEHDDENDIDQLLGETITDKKSEKQKGILSQDKFSVRWTGRIEAPLSEKFTFHVFNRDNQSATAEDVWIPQRAGVRVWLDGELIIDQWQPDRRGSLRPSSGPIPLEAGEMYDLRIEYANWTDEPTGFSLVWECRSWELHRVPGQYLYTENE